MTNPLRLGVIGLGRRWRTHYRPVLRALRDRFVVAGLYDEVFDRAEREARRFKITASPAVTALVERADIDAVLLADPQWFGLLPLEAACRFRKPVLCGVSLLGDDAHFDTIRRQVLDAGVAVMVAMSPRHAAATARLRELLRTELGPARFLFCEAAVARPRARPSHQGGSPCGSGMVALVDWCAGFMEGEPLRVEASGLDAVGYEGVFLEFEGGRGAQIVRRPGPAARKGCRLHVVTESGGADVTLPNRVCWEGRDGRHVHILPPGSPAVVGVMERFYQAVRQGCAPEPNLEDAYRVLRWLRAARRSRAEGRRVDLPTSENW